ncbi:hypothetical protein [Gulosibacter hominis]|uniref:hypothetical protein n=1 Tax=Gulosibacter hominis TaxID=2770504 RepID=UPI00191983F3|nr:hypothetical protein [Gulosibacter hominis]
MLLVVGRVIAVWFAIIAAIQFVTAIVMTQWQLWISGAGLLTTAWAWWRLADVWREATLNQPLQTARLLRSKESAKWALIALAGIAATVIVMATLG